MKFACGIPLYHPTQENASHLEVYAQLFVRVYVFDNTEHGSADVLANLVDRHDNIVVLGNGENQGLSRAYNVMCRQAVTDGFDFLAIYDQDSVPDTACIESMQAHIQNAAASDVAVFGPVICKYAGEHAPRAEARPVDVLISSGSFINLPIYAQTPGFDEAYFIDKVDDDYCLRAKAHGYHVIQFMDCLMVHKIGNHKKIFGKIVEQHSPLRMYYIVRNTMYLNRKYHIHSVAGSLYWLLDRVRHVLLYDDDKVAKVYMMLLGVLDYFRSVRGK